MDEVSEILMGTVAENCARALPRCIKCCLVGVEKGRRIN